MHGFKKNTTTFNIPKTTNCGAYVGQDIGVSCSASGATAKKISGACCGTFHVQHGTIDFVTDAHCTYVIATGTAA
jgi:hypothetical protein